MNADEQIHHLHTERDRLTDLLALANERNQRVVRWAAARNLIHGSDQRAQTIKLGEEYGEQYAHIARVYSASRPSKDEAITIQGIDIDRHIAPSNGHKLVTPSAAAMSRGTQAHTSAFHPRPPPRTTGIRRLASAPLACAS